MPTPLTALVPPDQLLSYFQPLISVKRKRCVAAQARVRVKALGSGEALSPDVLFERARQSGLALDLDRRCRQMALSHFAQLRDRDPELLLFLKFHGSVLDQDGVLGSGWMLDAVRELGLDPGGIVVELDDSPVEDLEALRGFVERCRAQGFLIAVNDLDDGNSNLKRLALLRPDIIKLGQGLVRGLDQDHAQREIVQAIAGLARRMGALVVAGGLETEAEVSACMELGADLFSGFYFSPALPFERWSPRASQQAMEKVALLHQARLAGAEKLKDSHALKHRALMQSVAVALSRLQPADFDLQLRTFGDPDEQLECLYLLDAAGWQVTDTVTLPTLRSRPRGALFKPAPKGTDHSYKDYFSGLMESGRVRHSTEPYISLASGNLCRTLSCKVRGGNGKDYVLCMDVRWEG
jgi:EAL domain-containing protein (putative c-di-GMP-specific phosphodiesterase class I)